MLAIVYRVRDDEREPSELPPDDDAMGPDGEDEKVGDSGEETGDETTGKSQVRGGYGNH